jgi:SAM-dependent methyltransferase
MIKNYLVHLRNKFFGVNAILAAVEELKHEYRYLSKNINNDHKDNNSDPNDLDYQTNIFNQFSSYVPTFVNKKVLVIGCGSGKDCSYFVDAGASLVNGLDIVDNIGCGFKHEKVKYFSDSAENMPFENNLYDYVYSVATMEHIHEIDKAFSEMVRVTKPGGIVYCFACPLWNSREGHHKFNLFPQYPWIHLRLSKEQIKEYCSKNNIINPNYDIVYDIEFMFSDYFNFLPSARYIEVCSKLPVSEIIKNTLYRDSEIFLTDEVFQELNRIGYSKEELLSNAHEFIAKK